MVLKLREYFSGFFSKIFKIDRFPLKIEFLIIAKSTASSSRGSIKQLLILWILDFLVKHRWIALLLLLL
jgi:hypothetical protein